MKLPNEKWLLNSLIDVILDKDTNQISRGVLVKYKNELEKTQNDRFVAYHLKKELSLLSIKQQASPNIVSFLSELSQHYNGLDVGMMIF